MQNDELDSLLRQSDPAKSVADPLLGESQKHWHQFVMRRQKNRRRLRVALATAAIGLIILTLIPSNDGDRVARLQPEDSKELGVREPQNSAAFTPQEKLSTVNDQPAIQDQQTVAAVQQNVSSETTQTDSAPKTAADPQLDQFAEFIHKAGPQGSTTWTAAVIQLSNSPAPIQRSTLQLVTEITDPVARQRSFDLVVAAAGNNRQTVLLHWLNAPTVRPIAWSRLISDTPVEAISQLVELAKTDAERVELCKTLARSSQPQAITQLLQLVQNTQWRAAVRTGASELNLQQLPTLIHAMRSNNRDVRIASAFIFASLSNPQIDQQLAELIVSGRYQQPAYIALLSRNTPRAKAFIAQANLQPTLSPSLYSARVNFSAIEKRLLFWIEQAQGKNHESTNTSETPTSHPVGNAIATASLAPSSAS
ncbi:hypothetical protein LOC67_13925 [Stieleria sp. JC731]|uniref:HEAT repeat domain-containing protein n=1 Tax=Pirellulaceae TaxID=2691357 RepID=UPI001E4B7EBB|nr:hypothetical protein [Stieleria sp. JC731]MCC9601652.1 hypothetical protein [Stieleria sp. JC731]